MSHEPLLPDEAAALLLAAEDGTGSTSEQNHGDPSNSSSQPWSKHSHSAPKKQIGRLIVNLICATTGTSTISVPLMALTLGMFPACVVVLIQSGLGVFANHVLSSNGHEEGGVTYQELMKRRVGPRAGRCAAAAIILNGAGKLVVWLIILTDIILGGPPHYTGLLPELLKLRGHVDMDAWYMQRPVWAAALGIISLPGVSFPSLDSISWVSSAGDIAVLFMAVGGAVLGIIATVQKKACPLNLWPDGEAIQASGPMLWLKVAGALPVLVSTVFNQHSILSVSLQLSLTTSEV